MTVITTTGNGIRVCSLHDLEIERGRAALISGEQIALFLLADGSVHTVSNQDPYSEAFVISRGIVGSREGVPTIASPMYKHVFDLRTGRCLDSQGKPEFTLEVWDVIIAAGHVFVHPPGSLQPHSAA